MTSKVTKKLKEPPSNIKKAEDSSTPTQVNVKSSPFRGSLLDMITLKPEHQKAFMDLLIGTKEDSPQSGAKTKELTFEKITIDSASDKAGSVLPKIAEDQPFSTDTVFSREQISSLEYARKMRELYKDTKLVRRTTLPSF